MSDYIPVRSGAFLLPEEKMMEVWPVVACDQYTAEPEYWQKADANVGESPSALRLILPEAYLHEDGGRIQTIHKTMREYLDTHIFARCVNGMVLLERTTESGVRVGIVLTVDLEEYDYTKGAKPQIRPTEGTVTERIPPRLRVREGAPVELSHVLLLIDDPERTVIEPLYEKRDTLPLLYDMELMLGGGHVRGWALYEGKDTEAITRNLGALKARITDDSPLIAVGDGNHSLATARAHWLKVRETLTEEQRKNHPARFAMAELENLHSEALIFEPIHRFVFDKSADEVLAMLEGACETDGDCDALIVGADRDIRVRFDNPLHPLPVGAVQMLLDRHPDTKIDYIHGEESVRELTAKGLGTGILLPAMDKALLFPAVAEGGVLPRKTFSMGEAHEKRYYLEAREIL
ncbi:MAG: DUF1015 domain-containing protein [Clostridia bacterium]|nr:DUF1015 domain-containing protein [Clostridia bacterium]